MSIPQTCNWSLGEGEHKYRFHIHWDAVRYTYINGVQVTFFMPISDEELKISIESDVQPNRNKLLFSKEMNNERKFDFLFDPPIQLEENDWIRIDWKKPLEKGNSCSINAKLV